ncbi:hypothetical protein A2574_02180 [Candidatus Shapirobacteria bacterium RIFOXYD1_FULL_38_32]|uniref:PKD domain containing protein n=3 Tax=Candidatus Shapironibacteriota TaxID=1752721 RepID=A0A0G0M7L0_9BACT|nr:MAG: PKD domain containing protein [Candidatus Shapirobacteria bacterium GW2011_GWE2_38_30]KKQ90531.1 MAG: PKD domain containing protein [Candidatus Shapirobacteria bacterium GW2011_GWE1_38_92]OGL56067.1 MAG: hypothetical protein A2195_02530 [Candidatus Shapirobacteria bacterium RIFOXYA1_FULL_39_17]OGL57304.1 MAG: hypothetical protein A2367_02245 [Candidatus Shapirobacteria bacterium RIFOXYB1_FULL_38_38]OGL57364.1 MAG: hypothetical protein A2410_02660 [Candidatus Shapirobacteria bacterium RI
MLIFLIALFYLIFASPSQAAPRICKFHAQDTSDWVEVCSDTGTTIDLSSYYIADQEQTNKKYLNCTFNTAINIPLSNILNNGGDIISLVEISTGTVVSSVRYCDSSISPCPSDSDVVDIKNSLCGLIGPDDSRTVSSDSAICLPLPAVCSVSSVAPSPTSPPSSSVSANLDTSITNLNSSANLGQNLTLSFSISSNLPNTEFYIKAFGGVNDDYSIETQNNSNWYNYNSAWVDLPKIKTGSDGKYSGQITIRPKSDKEIGNYRVQIKVRRTDGSIEKISGINYLSVSSSPTSVPTLTPTPTASITPTFTPTPTPTETPLPTDISESSVLAASDTNPDLTSTPTPASKSFPKINIPVVLMSLGSLLLLTPLVITKFSHAQKVN